MPIDTDSSKYGNSEQIERIWAVKAFEHAEIYFNLISSLDCTDLQFTNQDHEIYEKFRTEMKDYKIDILEPDELKSEASKSLWRPFCESFKGIVPDYNFGTLMRIDSSKEFSEENTILVPRIQFWAIEIARNREGLNKCHVVKRK